MKYSFKFRYYKGEKECPEALKNDGAAGVFWTMEKYISDNYRDKQEDAERAYDEAVRRGDFTKEKINDWPNEFHFIHAIGDHASEDEKFTAYCCRRGDDFSHATAYDFYFEGP